MKTQTIRLFLIFTLPTAGCDWIEEKIAQHKAEEERRYLEAAEKTRQDRLAWAKAHPIVGNLGGVPVSLPEFVVENVSYDDTPEPFSKKWKTYKIPEKRTYQDNLEGFGFVFVGLRKACTIPHLQHIHGLMLVSLVEIRLLK